MRVLMLSWEYPPHVVGGLGKHVADLLPVLARHGVEVHLLTPRWAGGEEHERVDGARVYRIDPPSVAVPDFYAGAWQANLRLEEHGFLLHDLLQGFDLIHAHDWLVAFASCALKRLHKIPLLSTIHATERGRSRGMLQTEMQKAVNDVEWWLAYESWGVICTSQFMAQELVDSFSVPRDKIYIIPNGVDTAHFDILQGEELSAFRAQYADPDEKLIFNVGRVVYEKGTHVLVEAVPKVLAEYPQAKFVIAGTGGMLDTLRERAAALGVSSKIIFSGFISDEDRNRLYRVADCAVFPSLYEPFGIVALEAMAARVPVVVSEVGGLRQVVQHGETAITVYPDDAGSLAWGILHTLQHPEWAAMRVENAYLIVAREYNWDHIAERTIEVYGRIIQERASTDW
jgi:glycogen(starch) synthase